MGSVVFHSLRDIPEQAQQCIHTRQCDYSVAPIFELIHYLGRGARLCEGCALIPQCLSLSWRRSRPGHHQRIRFHLTAIEDPGALHAALFGIGLLFTFSECDAYA